MKHLIGILLFGVFVLVAGCDLGPQNSETAKRSRYSMHASEGRFFRLDVETGEIVEIKERKAVKIYDADPRLVVGARYVDEKGDVIIYQGERRFSDDRKDVVDSLLEKYRD